MTPLPTLVAPSAADLYACDQYRFADLLTDVERTVLARLRAVLDVTVGPAGPRTHEINALVVARAATGLSAFTR